MSDTGPCIGLDTACSSSLVTTHLAANAVRTREAGTGITAGVNVMFSPMITAAICQLQVIEAAPMPYESPVVKRLMASAVEASQLRVGMALSRVGEWQLKHWVLPIADVT